MTNEYVVVFTIQPVVSIKFVSNNGRTLSNEMLNDRDKGCSLSIRNLMGTNLFLYEYEQRIIYSYPVPAITTFCSSATAFARDLVDLVNRQIEISKV